MPARWQYWLYPDLLKFATSEQGDALRRAKDGDFDRFELAGIGIAVVLAIALTRYSSVGLGLVERIGAAFANFVVAAALLFLLAGPFYVRRIRRGLAAQLRARAE